MKPRDLAARHMGFFSKLFTWWNGATFGTWVYTMRKGEKVGEDDFGNVYYKERGGERRWVIYNGYAEASAVPAAWHDWLHYTTSEPPKTDERRFDWQKQHLPNLTGTHMAHRPAGSILSDRERPSTTGEYDAWSPE